MASHRSLCRVPTDLESPGRPEKIKWSGKVKELFCTPKCQKNFFLNANYREIKICCDFHLKNVADFISCSR